MPGGESWTETLPAMGRGKTHTREAKGGNAIRQRGVVPTFPWGTEPGSYPALHVLAAFALRVRSTKKKPEQNQSIAGPRLVQTSFA